MAERRILIFGATGQIGTALRLALSGINPGAAATAASEGKQNHIIPLGHADADLTRPGEIRAAIRGALPDIIINAAAYTAVDRAESAPALAEAINAEAVAVMATEAARRGALLIHYSTDYVFNGRKKAPYVEEDAPHPLSAYGLSKLAGEIAAAKCPRHIILRTSWIYSATHPCFPRAILNKALRLTGNSDMSVTRTAGCRPDLPKLSLEPAARGADIPGDTALPGHDVSSSVYGGGECTETARSTHQTEPETPKPPSRACPQSALKSHELSDSSMSGVRGPSPRAGLGGSPPAAQETGSRAALRVVSDQFGAPTPASLVAEVTAHILAQIDSNPAYGLYHLSALPVDTNANAGFRGRSPQSNPDLARALPVRFRKVCPPQESGGPEAEPPGGFGRQPFLSVARPVRALGYSWYDFACFLLGQARAAGLDVPGPEDVIAISSADYPAAAARPENSVLDCSKLCETFSLRLPDWQAAAAPVLDQLFSEMQGGGDET